MIDRLDHLTVIALKMHEGQVDKQGRSYSEHILAVTEAVSDEAKSVALFHDAAEDGRASLGYISTLLYVNEFAAVSCLTRCLGQSYAAYIDGIVQISDITGSVVGRLARDVKIADLRHNLGRLTPELESLRSRYEAALVALGADR